MSYFSSVTLLGFMAASAAWSAPRPGDVNITIDCGASPDFSDGHVPAILPVKFRSVLTLRPAPAGSFVCNEAVNSPPEQEKDRVVSAETSVQLHQSGNRYLGFDLSPQPQFGACNLRPVPTASSDLRFGQLSVSLQKVLCPAGACGPYGVINSADPAHQIAAVSFSLHYTVDANGTWQLLEDPWYPHYVLIEYVPTGGDHFPFQLAYKMRHCTIAR